MTDWQQQVREFMVEVKELELPRHPTVDISERMLELCRSLMDEELNELTDAMHNNDLVAIADGIADLLYVVLYTANAYGIYMDPIFAEVQRSNMTKKGGPIREDGKQLKPDTYSPPDLAPLLAKQKYVPLAYIEDKEVAWLTPTDEIINENMSKP